MPAIPFNPLATFDHVIVLMLENRSFDNLLGNLYEDGVPTGKEFAGLQDANYSNPIPARANNPNKIKSIPVGTASDYHQPFPDPGEEYPHINTQLFDHIDKANLNKPAIKMHSPYNAPESLPDTAPMSGFVNDYINTLQAMNSTKYDNPTFDQYKVIMEVFKPDQVSVMSTLAKEFAVFDHWHCSVPSQTWCNRAFWHAATSAGFVINPVGEDDEGKWQDVKDMWHWKERVWPKPTLFTRLHDKRKSCRIYSDNTIALTHLIHGFHESHFARSMKHFYKNVAKGSLKDYSFVEPDFLGQHNDQHPSSLKTETQAGTVLLGEQLIHNIYDAIKKSPVRDKILFIITHDEHGGNFDHISPKKAVPPQKNMPWKQDDFNFDRLGVRVPMIMISSHIARQTIVNEVHDHTSFLKMMATKFDFPALTDRDAQAAPFDHIFNQVMRDWPEVEAPVMPIGYDKVDYGSHPLNDLQHSILKGASAAYIHKQELKGDDLDRELKVVNAVHTVSHALDYLERIKHKIF